MTIDLKKIREEHIKGYGEFNHHKEIFGEIYSDRTHFVYELLQNAEDEYASVITFRLKKDQLEVLHNGEVFDERDVRGICSLRRSPKAGDPTKIGNKGIGFKSVYGYTKNPEVHCMDNHFCIEDYVCPYEIEERNIDPEYTTLFVLPFDRENEESNKVTPQLAFEEISQRLRKMGIRTLLFLRNLEEISYEIEGEDSGNYLRESKDSTSHRKVQIIGQEAEIEIEEHWLIFSKPLPESLQQRQAENSDNILKTEIAFQVEELNDNKRRIIPVQSSKVTVSFPTDKETHLGFLIQAPFKTNPARDNIPEQEKRNKILLNEVKDLLSSTFPEIKKLGLLSVSFLKTLPIREIPLEDEWLQWFLPPLYEASKEALITHELLPTDDGQYVKASNAILSRSEDLRKIISHQQLSALMSSSKKLKWLTNDISQNAKDDLRSYLIKDLGIEEFTPTKFANKLGNKSSENFLHNQSDDWFVDFYRFLSGQPALWREGEGEKEGTLRRIPIIKCQDEKIRAPFEKGTGNNPEKLQVYLPIDSKVNVPTVKWRIYHDAKHFLETDLRLVKPNICDEVIESILGKYRDIKDDDIEALIKNYENDLRQINTAFKSSNRDSRKEFDRRLSHYPWVLCENIKTGNKNFVKAGKAYYSSEKLRLYFNQNESIWFVCEYEELNKTILDHCGVKNSPRVTNCKGIDERATRKTIALDIKNGRYRKGLMCFDPDATIDGLEHALKRITPEKSVYIWNEIASEYYRFIRGIVETATRLDFKPSDKKECVSVFGELLNSKPWIKTNSGWKSPSKCRVDELPVEFKVDDKVVNALQVKPSNKETQQSTINELKTLLDCPEDVARQISVLPSTELFAMLRNHNQPIVKPVFPVRQSKNPERRSNKNREQQARAGNKTYEQCTRSARVSEPPQNPKVYLSDLYTNDDNRMICQMCEGEMPFRLSNGKYHFESVQIDDIHPAESHKFKIALCPLCSAKYRFLLKKDDSALNNFLGLLTEADSTLTFPISLANEGEHSIRFVEIHLQDVRDDLENPVL